MRKLSSCFLAIIFTFTITGCNANNNTPVSPENNDNNTGTNLQQELTNSIANNDEQNAPGNNTTNNPQQEITNSTANNDETNAPGNNTATNPQEEITNSIAQRDEKNAPGTNNVGVLAYREGVYSSQYKNSITGYEEAIVTIQNGRITKVELKKLDDNKKEVNYNDWNGTKWGYPNLKQYRQDLANAMINKQSPDVDSISGATESSKAWKAAVAEALSKSK